MTDISRSLTDLGHVTSATEFSHYFLSKLFSLYIKSCWEHHLFGICLGAPGIRFKLVKKFTFGVPQAVIIFSQTHKIYICSNRPRRTRGCRPASRRGSRSTPCLSKGCSSLEGMRDRGGSEELPGDRVVTRGNTNCNIVMNMKCKCSAWSKL